MEKNGHASTTNHTANAEYGGHTGKEWGQLMLDSGTIGMIIGGLTGGSCPGIPSIRAFILCFGIVTLSVGFIKFQFKLARPIVQNDISNDAKKRANAKSVVAALGPLQLIFGIWGISITYPNTKYFSGERESCPFGIYVCAFIPSTIIGVVVIVLIAMGLKYLAVDRHTQLDDDAHQLDPSLITTDESTLGAL
jgi:hypothetical protein